VIITGAGRGIGAAAVRAFAAAGNNVVLAARSADAIGALAKETGGLAVPCDVADYRQVEAVVAATVERFGGVDVLINNAGVIEPVSMLAESDPEAWGRAIDINLKGVYYGMRAVFPVMKAAGHGTILTISSGAAHTALEGWSHYCASKAGAAMLTMSAHKEVAGAGIRVLGLSPGTVATQMQREIRASGVNPVSLLEWEDHIPPEWVAKCLQWMCTRDADEYRGQEIRLKDRHILNRLGLPHD
jgi:NAD(P)-dependent dehydrogenase (short-subunit alcohol dehydrogenase family)